MIRLVKLSLIFALGSIAACEGAPSPADPSEETVSGVLLGLAQTGDSIVPAGAFVQVTDANGDRTVADLSSTGQWIADDAGPSPLSVVAIADGWSGVEISGIGAGTPAVEVPLVERSTASVLDVVSAEIGADCGDFQCLNVRFSVAADGVFGTPGTRQIFRIFLGSSDDTSPQNYAQSLPVIITDDHPLLQREAGQITVTLRALRGFDYDRLPTGSLTVYVAGATENSVIGPLTDAMPELGFPDLSPVGARAIVAR